MPRGLPPRVPNLGRSMFALRIAGVGTAFVACVVGGFWIGIALARRTGASWVALAGIAGGLIAGVAVATLTARRALRE